MLDRDREQGRALYRFFRAKMPAGVDDLLQRTFLALLERAPELAPDAAPANGR